MKERIVIPVYNKLVRDEIPRIIEGTGKRYRASTVSGPELIGALQEKLFEELQEFVESEHNLEELADLLEVIEALAHQLGSSLQEVMELKEEKRKKRGGFEKGLWLEWVED